MFPNILMFDKLVDFCIDSDAVFSITKFEFVVTRLLRFSDEIRSQILTARGRWWPKTF